MDALVIIPFILFLVVIFSAIAERINIPYPILLVIVGLVVGFIPGLPNWHPPGNIVLALFLPPILFASARLITWKDIKNNSLEISVLSLVLVIASSVGMAFILPKLAPMLAIAPAFVLGAIISPTDCISATSILNKLNAKQRLVRSLEIESLFNDAISITLYGAALYLVFTGTVEVGAVAKTLVPSALLGIAIGLVLSYFTGIIVDNFLRDCENELPIIMSLVLAYVAYLFAEEVGASGVLSVVAAGLFHTRTERKVRANTRLAEKASWDTYIFFLNGLIFIVIGLQFPVYLNLVKNIPVERLIIYSLASVGLLLMFRFILVCLLAGLGKLLMKFGSLSKNATAYTWRDILISTWSGMRGLVSLALAIALPLNITPDVAFPDRNLIIFLTIIVIMFTVVVQGLTLPFLINWLGVPKSSEIILQQSNETYRVLTEKAVRYIAHLKVENKLTSNIAKELIDNYYESRLLQFNLAGKANVDSAELGAEAEKWLVKILDYERAQLHYMLARNLISQEVYTRILHKIDRDEVGFALYQ